MSRCTDKQQFLVGVDIAKHLHVARCFDNRAVEQGKRCSFAQNQSGFTQFFTWLLSFGDRESVVIGMEATGHYWSILHSFLIQDGWTVEVMNPILTSHAARRSIRGCKSDASDAKVIAKCVRDADYTPASVAEDTLRDLQQLTRTRGAIVKQQTAIKLHVHASLDMVFPEWKEALNDCHCTSFIALLTQAPSAVRIAQMSVTDVHTLLKKHSRGRFDLKKARDIYQCARRSIAHARPMDETVLLLHLQNLQQTQQLCAEIEKQITAQKASVSSPLQDIPYAGDISHAIILAEYGDVRRFLIPTPNNAGELRSCPGQMLAFAGFDPRIRQSGLWQGKVKMTKRGSGALRSALLRCADTARKSNPYFKNMYLKHKSAGKAHYVALSHVARTYIHALFGKIKYGDTFNWDIYTHAQHTKMAA